MTADDTKDERPSRPPAESADVQAADEPTPAAKESATADPSASGNPGVEASSASDAQPDELEALRKERSELAERLLRTAADFDNFRKRARREVDEAKLRGKDDALRELLPVFDNLERAVRASGDASDSAAIVEGVRMVLKLFEDTTQRMGLNRVPTVGERFDPAVHEAIQQQESSEHTPGTIIAEITPGYLFGKRLLRAAMVVVARRPASAQAAADPAATHGGEPKATGPEGGSDAERGESRGAAADTASESAPR